MFPLAGGLIEPTAPGGRPVRWAVTGRSGGVSAAPYDTLNLSSHVGDDPTAVLANRTLLAWELGLPAGSVALMEAVHGADVLLVDEAGTYPGVDALVTRTPNLAVVAMGADCVPVVLMGADGATVAVAHCGWRGLAADVVGAVTVALRDCGTDIRMAILGPSVCGRCYPVPADRAAELASHLSASVMASALVTTADGQPGIDVREALAARLAELGVVRSAISRAGGCTVEDRSLFSFRRDGITGRQAVAVCSLAASMTTPAQRPQWGP